MNSSKRSVLYLFLTQILENLVVKNVDVISERKPRTEDGGGWHAWHKNTDSVKCKISKRVSGNIGKLRCSDLDHFIVTSRKILPS